MANTFKRAVAANIDTALVSVYTVPATTTTVVIGLLIANVSGSAITITAQLVTTGATVHIAKNIPIPAGSSIEVMAGNKFVLETTDIIKVSSSETDSADAILSFMEIT